MERLALLGPWDKVDVGDLAFMEEWEPGKEEDLAARPVMGLKGFDLPGDRLDLEVPNREIIRRTLRVSGETRPEQPSIWGYRAGCFRGG